MVVETEVIPYLHWLLVDCGDGRSAIIHFLVTALVLLSLSSLFTYLVAAFRHGPVQAAIRVARALSDAAVDLVRMSPRRVFALAVLAVREAVRRYIWVVGILFLLILMFAGWFLDPGADEPAKLHLNFVITGTTYLMLLVALYFSALSLPADIKSRAIYTIVTKPVRASEIVLGRIIGFSFTSTVLLVVMAGASYLFVGRTLNHRHDVPANTVSEFSRDRKLVRYDGQTSLVSGHRHKFSIPANEFSPGVQLAAASGSAAPVIERVTAAARAKGLNPGDIVNSIDDQPSAGIDVATLEQRLLGPAGSTVKLSLGGKSATGSVTLTRATAQVATETERGHWHTVTARWVDGKPVEGGASKDQVAGHLEYDVGPCEGMLKARVPIYGTLRFHDRNGNSKDPNTGRFLEKGINVGKLFTYRSFIEGNTLATAIFQFEGLRERDFPNGLPLDVTIRVFRSHKGNIEEGITGSIQLRRPQEPGIPGLPQSSVPITFKAKDNSIDRMNFPMELPNPKGSQAPPLKLFGDLVSPDGKLEVWVQCVQPGQYFGMARGDIYVRGGEASYAVNFIKAFVEVWLQVLLVTALAVLFSTFLSGPVAIVLTATTIVMGFCTKFIYYLTNGVIYSSELQAVERLRQNRMSFDQQGIAQLIEWQKQGKIQFSLERLEQMRAMKLHEADVLDRVYGGGPLEAAYRLVTQKNQLVDLDAGVGTQIMKSIDGFLMHIMQYVLHVLPDFRRFADTDYLAGGYNIPADLVLQHVTVSLAFVLSAFVAGYFVIKYREMAR